jgi:hypothetical protein
MDPQRRATRPATDYMGRGNDPANVPVARGQKLADQFYTVPGGRVPNNTLVGNQIQMEVGRDNGQVYSNPYQDWRGANLPGASIDYGMQRPAPAVGRMMTPQAIGQSESMGDLRWAGQVNGMGGPLAGPPNEWVANPGLMKEVQRYPTGQPVGRPLPPGGPPPGQEDLRSAKTPVPTTTDLMFAGPDLQAASRVEGSPADALLPRAGRGSSPGKGGRPAVMPQPR